MSRIGGLKPSLDAKKESHNVTCRTPSAEGEGFKPPIPERGIPDFESSAIDHSANLPFAFCGYKVNAFFRNNQK